MDLFRLDEESWNKYNHGPVVGDEEKSIEDSEKLRWEALQGALGVPSVVDNPRAMIVFEFMHHIVSFCSHSKFSYNQMSAVLAVFGEVFNSVVDEAGLCKTREDAIDAFTSRIMSFAQKSEVPAIFDTTAVKGITGLFADTIIKHFDAYIFVMRELPVERVQEVLVVVQTPISSLPHLSEGERMDPSCSQSLSGEGENGEES